MTVKDGSKVLTNGTDNTVSYFNHVNATDTGGWDTLTPYKLKFLAKSGVYNPVKELIDDPHMIFVGDYLMPELTEYYTKWYCGRNETIGFVKVGEVYGQNLYNVVKVKQ